MGRKSGRNEHSAQKDIRAELLEQASSYFEDFVMDVDDLKIQWGILSVSAIRELDLSEDELAAMLMSQLDLRDTFIESLESKLLGIVAKGRSLEDQIRYLLDKAGAQEEKYNEKSKFDGCEEQIKSGDSGERKVKSEKDTDVNHDKYRYSSEKERDDANLEKSKTEKKGDDGKDKIRALVAMAFEAHGIDLPDVQEQSMEESQDSSEDEKMGDSGWRPKEGKSISDQVEAAASKVVVQSGYVFHEELGLYYDQTSGYYYNAENGLYYDPKTGTYFFYDHNTQSYQFHSQVPVEGGSAGNCSSDKLENVSGGHDAMNSGNFSSMNYPENQGEVPPSIRLMVTESGVDKVKVGETSHIVNQTKMNGGKVGRNPENLIQLLDVNVSKEHAEFVYRSDSPDDHHYFIKDLGSIQGTYINGTCICIPGEPSDEIEVGHGWEIQFGSIKMKCHIHPGYLSCNECEPGIVRASQPQLKDEFQKVKPSVEKTRLKVLKAMKKKYAYGAGMPPQLPSEYEDRAKKRRKEKGSDNPYEKTEVASTQTELKDTNKGFEMLKKMGWSKGDSLGKSQSGITAPIEAASNVGRGGLGFASGLPPQMPVDIKRKKILDVTVQRFKKL
ncbi:LOW QUALITY PROTEIN: angiogenic factor with G patch and FHA domains 1-like [Macrobrachium nipponense]|uniref:LOW QUALITY PROTEIN: angiogenic factor with G patch and FHA domains 1-like n=1 Tax=Macrobrachium nipponense TaxID=159736 RepID=UPI0030C8A467